jgi:hypothetical protein
MIVLQHSALSEPGSETRCRITTRVDTAVLVGMAAVYVGLGVSYFTLTNGQANGNGRVLLLALEGDRTAWILHRTLFVASGILGLAAVPAIRRLAGRPHDAALEWASTVGLLGFAVLALDCIRGLGHLTELADLYVTADEGVRPALSAAAAALPLDPIGYLSFGAVGVWTLVASVQLGRRHIGGRYLPLAGIGAGVLYLAVVAGNAVGPIDDPTVQAVVAGLTIIVAPLFYGTAALIAARPLRGARR